MISLTMPLGPFFDMAGAITPGGAVQLLEPSTDVDKTAYYDESETIPTINPLIIGSDGRLQAQVFLGQGDYKVRQWMLTDPSNVTPVFPDDYTFVREWLTPGQVVTPVDLNNLPSVATMADLSAVDPGTNPVVQVIGYYTADDQVAPRTFYWNPYSTLGADGGSVVLATGYVTGRWILKFDGSVVDCRWFGAIPGYSSTVNSSFTSAAAYASGSSGTASPRTLYIPYGQYLVSAGVLSVNANIKVDEGVKLFVTTAGTYTVQVRKDFDISLQSTLNHTGGVGTANFDFRFIPTNLSYAISGEVSPEWFSTPQSFLESVGSVAPVVIPYAASVYGTVPLTISRVRFQGVGTLAMANNSNITFNDVVVTSGSSIHRFTGGSPSNTRLGFGAGCRIKSSWLDQVFLSTVVAPNATLLLDTPETLIPVASSLSNWGAIESCGGYVNVPTGISCDAPVNMIGKVFRCSGTVVAPYPSVSNFYLDSGDEVVGFIRSCLNASGTADFAGVRISSDIDLSEFAEVRLSSIMMTGSITVPSTGPGVGLILENCNILGPIVNGYANYTIHGGVFAPSISEFDFLDLTANGAFISCLVDHLGFVGKYMGCTININNTAKIQVGAQIYLGCKISCLSGSPRGTINAIGVDCVISGCNLNNIDVIAGMSVLSVLNLTVKSCEFNNSYIIGQGTGHINRLIVDRVDFNNSIGLIFYDPIQYGTLTVTADPNVTGELFIGNCTPAYVPGSVKLKTVGTNVRQTTWKTTEAISIIADSARTVPFTQNMNSHIFAPWTVDGVTKCYMVRAGVMQAGVPLTQPGCTPIMRSVTDGVLTGIGIDCACPLGSEFVSWDIDIYLH